MKPREGPKWVPAELGALVQPHVASFNYFLDQGLSLAVQHIEPVEVRGRLKKSQIVALFDLMVANFHLSPDFGSVDVHLLMHLHWKRYFLYSSAASKTSCPSPESPL
jgi:hypothetical protein